MDDAPIPREEKVGVYTGCFGIVTLALFVIAVLVGLGVLWAAGFVIHDLSQPWR